MHRCLNQELLYEHSSHFIFDVAEWMCEKGQGRSPTRFGVIFSPMGGRQTDTANPWGAFAPITIKLSRSNPPEKFVANW